MPTAVATTRVEEAVIFTPAEAQKQADDMFYRNSKESWKPRKVRRFKVSSPKIADGAEGVYSAVNDLEAWAMHCDAHQKYPGGWRKNQGKIEAIGEAEDAPPVAPMPAIPKPKAKA